MGVSNQHINAAPGLKPPGLKRFITLFVLFSTLAAWLALTFWHKQIPVILLVLAGGFVVCLYSSLQHEAIHGHLRDDSWSYVLIRLPVLFWMPYESYKTAHLKHHDCARLTDPIDDPESFYFTPAQWQQKKTIIQWLYQVNQTLVGRLLLGPWVVSLVFIRSQLQAVSSGDSDSLRNWLVHGLFLLPVVVWLITVCEMSIVTYVINFLWPGTALMLLRSFYEHRSAEVHDTSCVIVEGCPVTRLLYLNNNYHLLHHKHPELPWYELGRAYRSTGVELRTASGDFYFKSYWSLFKQYAFKRKDSPVLSTQS